MGRPVRYERIHFGNKKFDQHCKMLYKLLAEREPHVNISHTKMPAYDEHVEFAKSGPYKSWWALLNSKGEYVGATYMSKNNEIGIFIFKAHRGHGYGKAALRFMRLWYKGDVYANIAPTNNESKCFFERLGFKEIQRVFKLSCRSSS